MQPCEHAPPVADPAPSARPLAFALSFAAAARRRSPAEQHTYWYNVKTGDSKWERPLALDPRHVERQRRNQRRISTTALKSPQGYSTAAMWKQQQREEETAAAAAAAAAAGAWRPATRAAAVTRAVAPTPPPPRNILSDARRCPLPTAYRSPHTQIPRTSKYIRRSSSSTSDVGYAPSRARRNARCGACTPRQTPRRGDSDSGPLLPKISAGHLSWGWGEKRAERKRRRMMCECEGEGKASASAKKAA
jgi:hypothetical protein